MGFWSDLLNIDPPPEKPKPVVTSDGRSNNWAQQWLKSHELSVRVFPQPTLDTVSDLHVAEKRAQAELGTAWQQMNKLTPNLDPAAMAKLDELLAEYTQLVEDWEKLSPRWRQSVSEQTARAFNAIAEGTKSATDELTAAVARSVRERSFYLTDKFTPSELDI